MRNGERSPAGCRRRTIRRGHEAGGPLLCKKANWRSSKIPTDERCCLPSVIAGEMIGEMSLLESAPRMAGVRARAASLLLAIEQSNWIICSTAAPRRRAPWCIRCSHAGAPPKHSYTKARAWRNWDAYRGCCPRVEQPRRRRQAQRRPGAASWWLGKLPRCACALDTDRATKRAVQTLVGAGAGASSETGKMDALARERPRSGVRSMAG